MNEQNEKIIDTICRMLGPADTYKHFAPTILVHINTAAGILSQNGIRPDEGFIITENTTWSDYIDEGHFAMVKDFIFIKTKIIFDPPANSFVLDALEQESKELLWRIESDSSSIQN